MIKSNYDNFLSYMKGKKIIITTHDLVDLDGLVSCFALKFFLTEYSNKINVLIYLSELSKPTSIYMEKFTEKFPEFKFSYKKKAEFSKYDVCIIVDANEINQVRFDSENYASQLDIPYIFIDHHHYNQNDLKDGNLRALNIIDDNFSSTVEIILNFFEFYSKKVPLPYKFLMISAILTDSGFFKYGNNTTIKNVSRLLENNLQFQEIQLMLEKEIDLSEKIAQIKGIQRVTLIREGKYLIGSTNVSSFGATVASTLIKTGFDIGIVYSKEKEQNIINSRAKKSICLKTGLHLGKIFEELAENFGGSGGGHDGAASLTSLTELDIILKKIIEKIIQALQSKF